MRKILAALIFIAALSGTSWANVLYTTDNGKLGIIGVQGVLSIDAPAVQYDGIGNNAFVASFWNGHETRVITVNRTSDDTVSGDTAFVFKSSKLSEPINRKGNTLKGIYNTQAAASSRNGRGLFIASRENASIVELNTENLQPVRSYTYRAKSGDTEPHMQGILMSYSNIYGLVEAGEAKSVFIRLDGQLKEHVRGTGKTSFDQEAASMSWLSGSRVAVATSSGIGLIGYGGLNMQAETENPAKSVCPDDGNGFYFITQEESGETYISRLYHHYPVDDETAETSEIYTNESGKNCQLLRFLNKSMIAAIAGDKILLLDSATSEVLKEFDSNALGGVPVSIASDSVSGDSDDSSNGSCTLSGAGIFMLLAFAGIAVKCRK